MKILITGGHYTPALAVIEELKGHEIVFVGRKYSIESELTESPEYKHIKSLGIKFIPLYTGKVNRNLTLGFIFDLIRIFNGMKQAKKIIKAEKPDLVLSFGSYLAVPITLRAWQNKIPVYTHEQTIRPGLSNRFIGFFAKKIFISFDKTRRYFPTSKVLLTGNPIRKSIIFSNKRKLNINTNRPVIFITGGSLGSHSVNILIKAILKKLLAKYFVIHQTGSVKEFSDYDKLISYKKKLSISLKHNYLLREHFNDSQIQEIYSHADLIVSRAGANTIFEIILLQKPAILIPLPWSANKEQQKHAEFLKEAGVAEIFFQNQNPLKLNSLIEVVIKNKLNYKNNFKNISYLHKRNASKKIAKEILNT